MCWSSRCVRVYILGEDVFIIAWFAIIDNQHQSALILFYDFVRVRLHLLLYFSRLHLQSVAVVVVAAARKSFSNIHRIVGTRTHVAHSAPALPIALLAQIACKWKATLRRRRRWNIWIMKLIRCNLFTFVFQHTHTKVQSFFFFLLLVVGLNRSWTVVFSFPHTNHCRTPYSRLHVLKNE